MTSRAGALEALERDGCGMAGLTADAERLRANARAILDEIAAREG